MAQLIQRYGSDNIHFIDGFPLPVCSYTRARKHKNFKEYAGFSYCAAKQEKYYGFKAHIVINLSGMISGYTLHLLIVMSEMLHLKLRMIFTVYWEQIRAI